MYTYSIKTCTKETTQIHIVHAYISLVLENPLMEAMPAMS